MNTLTYHISLASYILILLSSFATIAVLWVMPEVKRYWISAFRHRGIFLLFLLTMAAPFLGGARTDGGGDSISIVRWIRFVIIICIFMISIVSILRLGSRRTPMGAPAKWMISYALLCMTSAIYSVDPVLTAWKSIEILSLVLSSVYICGRIHSWNDVQDILNILCLSVLFFCVSTLVGAAIAPDAAFLAQTSGFSLRGLAPADNSNSVSQWGILLATIALARVLSISYTGAKTSLWFLFGLGISVALLGHSRTALFAGALAITILLLFGRHYKTAGFTILCTLLIMLFGGLSESVSTYVTRGQDEELFLSMSNRTYFWEKALDVWAKRPILGYGFYAGLRSTLGFNTVDNAYLEVAVGTGIIGLIVFTAAPISAVIYLLRSVPRKPENFKYMVIWLQLMSVFVLILLRSFTSTSFSGLHPNTIIFVITTTLTASMYRLLKNNKHASHQSDLVPGRETTNGSVGSRYVRRKR